MVRRPIDNLLGSCWAFFTNDYCEWVPYLCRRLWANRGDPVQRYDDSDVVDLHAGLGSSAWKSLQ
jgi:hypothetical protein